MFEQCSHAHTAGDAHTTGDACGQAPHDPQNISFLPSRHRNKAGRHINRNVFPKLVGINVPQKLF
jgi:hypothetical protein